DVTVLAQGITECPQHRGRRNRASKKTNPDLFVPLALLCACRERPRGRDANERDEVAPFHCSMPPVLRTERIAHLGTADCCIHPPGRNKMIAITPPIISSKEGAQKQATPFPRQDLLTARNRF